jgi:SAM-dependent methyltransferase
VRINSSVVNSLNRQRMKTGLTYNCTEELFSRAYALTSGGEPYPLRSFLRQEIEKLAPKKILEVGCGTGRFAFPGYDYLGIDPNPHYVAYCRRRRPGRFEQMSGEQLDLPDNTFDAVFCLAVGHHLPANSLRRVLSEIDRVLTDDGVFFFTDLIRPIVRSRAVAALLEWLDEGRWFRREEDYLELLGNQFVIEKKRRITDAFYQMLVLVCRKNRNIATR